MSTSCVVLLTAFYVDNGPHLPTWDRLPPLAWWTLPSLVGLPLARSGPIAGPGPSRRRAAGP